MTQTHKLADFLALSREHPRYLAPLECELPHGTRAEVWDTGVLCLEPASPGERDLVISCGIHGNETAPIELCEALLKRLIAGSLLCRQRVLFIFGNLAGMNAGRRELDENMNRLFSGAHAQGERITQERKRAALLESYVTRFFSARGNSERLHYDLHTAIRPSQREKFAVYPFLHGAAYSASQLAFLQASGINTVLLAHAPTSTFSYFSARRFNAHAFTLELGKVMPFGKNDLTRLTELAGCLEALISDPAWQPPALQPAQLEVFGISQEIFKQSEHFRLAFASNVSNFTSFTQGDLLATDEQQHWHVKASQEAVVFPNADVAPGHRAALMVVPLPLADLPLG
ncbi:succinylglutamate desuccinylase [Oceanimonas baumannii]|uniref:Succinylglutamate desuccinylase n=1 Tax=Oceanimonas baumannii TaxID=129578 RepID=A0A235CEQ8_9GAMM|nr:succinylglutamate desuccinylase [Oceanimonas baumannii]OYD23098.1 succinylglutamate desuccinylase [Oceanimonas baumannii]TDW58367.1 succinylglutamate desuccinylase [Oceanimonas baumannii]